MIVLENQFMVSYEKRKKNINKEQRFWKSSCLADLAKINILTPKHQNIDFFVGRWVGLRTLLPIHKLSLMISFSQWKLYPRGNVCHSLVPHKEALLKKKKLEFWNRIYWQELPSHLIQLSSSLLEYNNCFEWMQLCFYNWILLDGILVR